MTYKDFESDAAAVHDQDPNFSASIRNSLATTLTRIIDIYIKRFALNTVPLAALVLANKSQVLQSSESHLKLQSRLRLTLIIAASIHL